MKTILLLCTLLCLSSLKTHAQYAEFAMPETEMWITENDANGPPHSYFHFVVNTDTIIEGINYHNMLREKITVVGTPSVQIKTIGYFHQAGGLITILDTISDEILPYFNLDAEVGDTLSSPIYFGIEDIDYPKFRRFEIDSIYDTILSGITLKKFSVNYLNYESIDEFDFFWNSNIFIEQIGFLGYPIQWYNPGGFDGYYPGGLRCYQNPELGLIKFVEEDCTYLETSIKDFQNSNLNIYPNPANNIITVENASDQLTHFELFSITGIQYPIKNISKINNQTQIGISFLESGMYILYIKNESGIIQTKSFFKL